VKKKVHMKQTAKTGEGEEEEEEEGETNKSTKASNTHDYIFFSIHHDLEPHPRSEPNDTLPLAARAIFIDRLALAYNSLSSSVALFLANSMIAGTSTSR
jgi:hypothetical protein